MGEKVKIAAQVHTLGGLSAHADQEGMMQWYKSFESRPPVLLVHGEPKSQKVLAKRMKSELGAKVKLAKKGKSTDLLNLESF